MQTKDLGSPGTQIDQEKLTNDSIVDDGTGAAAQTDGVTNAESIGAKPDDGEKIES